MNKGIITLNEQIFFPVISGKDLFILMNEFEQESHKRASQNRARLLLSMVGSQQCKRVKGRRPSFFTVYGSPLVF